MPVGIVADSAASLPAAVAEPAGVRIVPLALRIGQEEFEDRVEDIGGLIARLDGRIATSAPSPGRFAEEIAAADKGDGVVVITVAAAMSATHNAAHLAGTLHDGRVEVIDSGTAAGAEGLVALAAAGAARVGASIDEVAATARRVAARVRLRATVADLRHLAQSGRVPGAVAAAGDWLNMNPVFEFRRGRALPRRPARSRDAAIDTIVSACVRGQRPGATLHAAALYVADAAVGEELMERVRERTTQPIGTAILAPFSAVMVAHTGPGLVGLGWWWEPPP